MSTCGRILRTLVRILRLRIDYVRTAQRTKLQIITNDTNTKLNIKSSTTHLLITKFKLK